MMHAVVKLTDGSELYGKLHKEACTEKMISLECPLVMHEISTEEGNGTAMPKFCQNTPDEVILISKSSVVAVMSMTPEFVELYEVSVKLNTITSDMHTKRIKDMTDHSIEYIRSHQSSSNTIH